MCDLTVAGAGMAGLAAAVRAVEGGARVTVLEKGSRVGGSMLLSSGVIWRHASFEGFRSECPDGDPALQRLIYDLLPESLEWLERLGARVLERETARPGTTGMRFDTASLTDTLARRAGTIRLDDPLRE